MKPILLTIFVVLLSGCIGTMDTIIEVAGETEVNNDCQVQYVDAESGEVHRSQSVGPNYETSIVLGTSMLPIDINLVCNGKIVSSLKKVYQSPWPDPLLLNGGGN